MHAAITIKQPHRAICGLLMLVVLAACSSAGSASDGAAISYSATNVTTQSDLRPYHDPTYPFEMQFPRSWYIGQTASSGYGIVAASSNDPAQSRAAISVAVETVTGMIDLRQAAMRAEATLREQAGVAAFTIEDSHPSTVNGLPAQERAYSYMLNQQKVRQRSMYISYQHELYDLSLITPQALYSQYDQLFSTIVATFKAASS